MERNIYAALLLAAALGFLMGLEWLFLTFVLLAIALALMEHSSPLAPAFDAGPAAPAGYDQQPVVIQSTQSSAAHQFYSNLVNNIVQESLIEHRPNSPFKSMAKKLDAMQGKLDKMSHGSHAGGHGGHDGHGGR